MENRLTEHQYVYQHLTYSLLVAKNFYSYFSYTSLSDGIDALRKVLESLRDDTKVGSVVKGYLMRNDFFTNDKVELYFTRKERKVKEKITTETTLNMANQRLALATKVVHKNVLNHLDKEAKNLGENENDEQKEAESSTHPVEVYNNSNYLDEIPPHAEYSHMGKDWIMNGINLSNNLKEIGIIKRGHFNFSDTNCISQISDDHWDKSIIPFLTNHKLKNAFSTKDDKQTLINMFGEEDKKKLLEPGNLNLIYSLTKIEEDAIKVLEIDHAMAEWYVSNRDKRAMDQNTVSISTPRAIETTLKLSKIKAKTRIDELDDDEEFENIWVELKGGFGNYHKAKNQNNRKDLDILLKGFSIMSAMQALTLPEDAKENIKEFRLPSFEGREGSGIQDLLYTIKIVYSFKVRVKASKLKFHQIRALARSKRIFEGDSSPIKAKRTRDHHTNLLFTTKN
ncbi:hypothetical protein C2G38_2219636 [Gigaspora rosea]|uniref:Uncharacterized protein n=1 Tax=Gigaspora rosea TaxID=44941 RepID=A0A397U8Q4_9GLOM|nr:hypothetical protein C2G38_2219636 [Gigaspora rosea]